MTKEVIGFAQLPVDVPGWGDILSMLDGAWQPHFNTNDYKGNWEVLSLRSPGGSDSNIFADAYGHQHYADTKYMQQLPQIKTLIDRLQCPVKSVRLLNLRAGAVIKPHRDHELAFEHGEARLHFPIITNDKVAFHVQDKVVPMLPGQCWYINANLPHSVANNGTTDRIHLVVDCRVNEWLTAIFAKAFKVFFKQQADDVQARHIIAALRVQDTATTRALADQMESELGQTSDG